MGVGVLCADPLICLVDDDKDVREGLGTFFRSAGIRVEKFAAAEELLASRFLGAMDCLITDLHMPGIDGLQLRRELQRRGNDVPVILMTAFPTTEAREEARTLGIAEFVPKPIDPETLLEKVEALLTV